VRVRQGTPDDLPAILALFDDALAWLVARGQTSQWGTQPFRERPHFAARLRSFFDDSTAWIAEEESEPVGIVFGGAAEAFVPQTDEPEVYVKALVTARRVAGRGVGAALLERVVAQARAAGIELVRVDCWAGAPRLVRWYEDHGFTATARFTVGEWEGQQFERRLSGAGAKAPAPVVGVG
jgi:GNAT superfamily N-acetyltransferase